MAPEHTLGARVLVRETRPTEMPKPRLLVTRSKNALRRIPVDAPPRAARVHLLNRT